MNRILLAVALAVTVGVGGWLASALHDRDQLIAENATLTTAHDQTLAEHKAYVDATTVAFAEMGQKLTDLQGQYDAHRSDAAKTAKILSEHDLTRLATAKPGLVGNRLNAGTRSLFDDLERATGAGDGGSGSAGDPPSDLSAAGTNSDRSGGVGGVVQRGPGHSGGMAPCVVSGCMYHAIGVRIVGPEHGGSIALGPAVLGPV